ADRQERETRRFFGHKPSPVIALLVLSRHASRLPKPASSIGRNSRRVLEFGPTSLADAYSRGLGARDVI
ncbi:MAG: hypothetical protein AVDCRST_MAG25-2939, partial [uncultured Rubrobacteraceae bacterium]